MATSGAGARPRHGEELDLAVIRQVEGGDLHAARERGVVGEEAADLGEGGAVPDADVRAAARAGPGDDVGQAIAVDVAGRDVHAAGERRVVGKEAADLGGSPRRSRRGRAGRRRGPRP